MQVLGGVSRRVGCPARFPKCVGIVVVPQSTAVGLHRVRRVVLLPTCRWEISEWIRVIQRSLRRVCLAQDRLIPSNCVSFGSRDVHTSDRAIGLCGGLPLPHHSGGAVCMLNRDGSRHRGYLLKLQGRVHSSLRRRHSPLISQKYILRS